MSDELSVNIKTSLPPTPEKNRSSNKMPLFLILVVLFGALSLITASVYYYPMLAAFGFGEYSAANLTDLEKQISVTRFPFEHSSPDMKGWNYLSVADKFTGTSKVTYFYIVGGFPDGQPHFGVRLFFPDQLNKYQISQKFDEALKRADLSTQVKGVGSYCTSDKFGLVIDALAENGFEGTRLMQQQDSERTSKTFLLSLATC